MVSHGPSCLSGPVTRDRDWWVFANPDELSPLAQPPMGREDVRMEPTRPDPAPDERPVRADLVERVRREIAAGTYDTPEKWEQALDRLLERLETD